MPQPHETSTEIAVSTVVVTMCTYKRYRGIPAAEIKLLAWSNRLSIVLHDLQCFFYVPREAQKKHKWFNNDIYLFNFFLFCK